MARRNEQGPTPANLGVSVTSHDVVAISLGETRTSRNEALGKPIKAPPSEFLDPPGVVGLQLGTPSLGINEHSEAVVADHRHRIVEMGRTDDRGGNRANRPILIQVPRKR